MPYEENEIKFIPQLFYKVYALPFGIQSTQIHLNYWKEEDFKTKVATIKESYFGKKESTSEIDDVAAESNAEQPQDLTNAMAAYSAAISKTKDIKLSN